MNPPELPELVRATRRIKRIGPLQLGKMLGLLYGIIGLLFIPVFLAMSALSSQMPGDQRFGFMAIGVGGAIFMPVIYAVMGFVFGVIGAFIYNLVAKFAGGIEIELE